MRRNARSHREWNISLYILTPRERSVTCSLGRPSALRGLVDSKTMKALPLIKSTDAWPHSRLSEERFRWSPMTK